MTQRHAVVARTVFDGLGLHHDHAVVIDGRDIAAILPRSGLPAGVPVHALQDGAWLAPGFIDCSTMRRR